MTVFIKPVLTPPKSIDGMIGWWDAADTTTITFSSGSTILRWNDKSTMGYHLGNDASDATSPSSGTRSHNSRNVVDFSGSNVMTLRLPASGTPGYPVGGFPANTGPFTSFTVLMRDTTSQDKQPWSKSKSDGSNVNRLGIYYPNGTNNVVYEFSNDSASTLGTVTEAAAGTGVVQLITLTDTGSGTKSLSYNQTAATTGSWTNAGTTAQAFCVGGLFHNNTTNRRWDGFIAEMIFYNRVLDSTEIAIVETYLKAKWAV